jgi:pimeloyl-ACP methyl ester carboxylesterase
MTTLALDGVDLCHTELGAGDPLLLVHGTGAYSAIWGEVPAKLAGTHRVIVYDRRGFGQSQGERAANAHQHVLDAAALLEHLGAAPAVIVGWSGGGVLAIHLAASRPDLVRSLVLIEPALHLALGPSVGMLRMSARMFGARIRGDKRAAATAMYRWANSYTSGGNGFDRLPPEEQEGMLAHAPSTVREMDQLTRPAPSSRIVRGVDCPVTCVRGSLSEPVFPRAIERVQRLLPQTRVARIDGGAHMLHRDRPDEWVRAVLEAAAAPVVLTPA